MSDLPQEDADRILAAQKQFIREQPIFRMVFGAAEEHDLELVEEPSTVLRLYINRKTKNPNAVAFHLRLLTPSTDLCRLDIGGSAHSNQDGTVVNCPHLHWYREGNAVREASFMETIDSEDFFMALTQFFANINVRSVLGRQLPLLEGGMH